MRIAARGTSPSPAAFQRWQPWLLVAIIWLASVAGVWAQPAPAPAAAPAEPQPAAKAVALPAGVTRLASVEGVTEYRLGNGMKVLLVPDQTKPSVTVNVTYLVGSRHENYGETGMAHLLEHLLFKGSPKHPDLYDEFKQRGVRANATTSVDRTNYFETLAPTGDNLEWALRMEADRMLNAYVAKKDLDSEMTVVRNEMESGENSPTRILYQRMIGVAYEWHNYGKSTIGARADVENVDIGRLQAFYHRYYRPDNATLIVGGRFDEAKTLATIADAFGPLANPPGPLPASYTLESAQDGEREVLLRRTSDIQHVSALYHTVAAAHPDFVAVYALAEILGATPSGRLHKALVETGKATAASGWGRDTREPGHVVFSATVNRTDSLDEVTRVLLDVVEGAGARPIAPEELQRVQVAAQKDFEQTIASPDSLVFALSEATAQGDWRLFFLHRDRLEKLTPEVVQQAAAKYLKPSNRTLGKFIPTERPDRAPPPTMVNAAEAVAGYRGRETVAAGEAFDPTPENIEARVVRRVLANGMQLVLLPKRTRGGTVEARMQLHFGDEKSLLGQRDVGRLAGSMLMRGSKDKSREQIRDAFDALKTEASIGGGPESASASLLSTREHLPAALRLVAEVLREPAFPESEFEQLQKQAVTGVEASRREPGAVASQAVRRHFNRYPPGDVRYVPSFDEQIGSLKAVTREQLARFHREFYGAQQAELSVVGDFDVEQLTALVTELFAGWIAPRPYARVPTPAAEAAAGAFRLETPDKANAVLIGAQPLAVRDDDADAIALMMANHLLGGSETSRLWLRVREKEGLSYDVRSGVRLNPWEPNTAWSMSAIFAPQNLERLRTALREEFERAHRDGFSEQEVEGGKKELLELRRLSRTDDGALASGLGTLAHRGRTAAFYGDNDRKIAALTRDEVNAALRKHLRLETMTTAVAGDFAKK